MRPMVLRSSRGARVGRGPRGERRGGGRGALCVAFTLALPFLVACTPLPRTIPASQFMENEFHHQRLGTPCAAHPNVRLVSDIVRVHFGIGYHEPAMEQFPNAHRGWGGGCVGRDPAFTEVAYCWKCRAGQTLWLAMESMRARARAVTQPRPR